LAGSIIDTLESSFQKGQYEATFLPVEHHQVRVSGQPQNGEDARAHHPAYVEDDLQDLLVYASATRNPIRNRVIVLLSAKAGLRAGEIANAP
jgi:integrase